MAARARRDDLFGFTLLEVMVAVAILGLSLTAVLSSQVGLFAGGTYGQNVSVALGLARCRMGEIEEQMAKLGFPETDSAEEGPCCNQTEQALRCSWRVERVELPQPNLQTPGVASGASSIGSSPLDLAASQLGFDPTKGPPPPGAMGPLGALANPANLTPGGGTSGLSSVLAGGSSSLAPMVMGMVYPALKPALEASIRKVTVVVFWREGVQRREVEVVQWLTNPLRGGLVAVPTPADSASPDGAGGRGSGGGATAPTTPGQTPGRPQGGGAIR